MPRAIRVAVVVTALVVAGLLVGGVWPRSTGPDVDAVPDRVGRPEAGLLRGPSIASRWDVGTAAVAFPVSLTDTDRFGATDQVVLVGARYGGYRVVESGERLVQVALAPHGQWLALRGYDDVDVVDLRDGTRRGSTFPAGDPVAVDDQGTVTRTPARPAGSTGRFLGTSADGEPVSFRYRDHPSSIQLDGRDVGVVDGGTLELAVATGLMTTGTPTVHRPAPRVGPRDEVTAAVVVGLLLPAEFLLAGAAIERRRRHPHVRRARRREFAAGALGAVVVVVGLHAMAVASADRTYSGGFYYLTLWGPPGLAALVGATALRWRRSRWVGAGILTAAPVVVGLEFLLLLVAIAGG